MLSKKRLGYHISYTLQGEDVVEGGPNRSIYLEGVETDEEAMKKLLAFEAELKAKGVSYQDLKCTKVSGVAFV